MWSKKTLTIDAKRALVTNAMGTHELSQRRACRVSVSVAQPSSTRPSAATIPSLSMRSVRWLNDILDMAFQSCSRWRKSRAGQEWNHKRVWRACCDMKLNICRRSKKRYGPEVPETLVQPIRPHQAWSIDFMSDCLSDGRALRTFNVTDDYNREVLCIDIDLSLTAERIIRTLNRVLLVLGKLEGVRLDHGPEFTSNAFGQWAVDNGIDLDFTQPG
jgi:putative transposase